MLYNEVEDDKTHKVSLNDKDSHKDLDDEGAQHLRWVPR